MLYTSNTIFWILNACMFTSSCWMEGCAFSVGFINKSYLWLRWAVPNGSFWKGAHFHPAVCFINTQCFEPRYQLWVYIMYNFIYYNHKRGTRWHIWLRHCATSQKLAGSIADGVIGFFHCHNPSGHTMTLGLTQPLTEMSTRNVSWG